jgi:hypothetical protein
MTPTWGKRAQAPGPILLVKAHLVEENPFEQMNLT